RKPVRVFVPQINEISLKLPSAPPLSQPEDVDFNSFCNGTAKRNCKGDFCYCPHILNVKRNSLIELILVDEGVVYWANHPFHLHGHTFQVLAMGRLGENTTLGKVQEMDAAGLIKRNYDHPPTKDTVTVPDGGYTIIRFVASNPGYWLFHCHISFHVEVGMGLVFHVGDQSMVPPVPKDFPKCGHWTPEPDPNFKSSLLQYLKDLDEEKVNVNLDLLPNDNGKYPGPSYSTPTQGPTRQRPSSGSIPDSSSLSGQKNNVASSLYLFTFVFFVLVFM
ncbi:Laccase-7-like, partial [Homarus americanus]